MTDHYFARVAAASPTRFWVNNPTPDEVELAIAHGAFGCTTNPTYTANLLRRDRGRTLAVIDEALAATADDAAAASAVQEQLVARVASAFLPTYEASGGRQGFVSLQGAPDSDTDGQHILAEGRAARLIAPNVTPKLPATRPGFEAMAELVADGSQVIVTEVFSLSQVVTACEVYERATARGGTRPAFFMSPITGILGDHLRAVAAREGLVVDPAALEWAGVILARRCHALVEARGYPVTLLAGGARTMLDFAGLVGGRMHATINWSTAAELVALDPPIRPTVFEEPPAEYLRALHDAFPEFRAALALDGLGADDFEGFGPVQFFHDAFLTGWRQVLATMRAERGGQAAVLA